MDFKEAIGALIAGIALLVPAIKWLVSDWAKKSEELEKLKNSNVKTALSRFEEDIKEFRGAVNDIRTQLRNLADNINVHRSDIATLKQKLVETDKNLDAYSKGFNEKIKNEIKTQVTNLTHQLMMIRNKKAGQ
jgi:chromosome segregation ATPase